MGETTLTSQALCHAERLSRSVLLKEMNDCVFVLDLLGKEFMRMANSISTKFMTWP